ncbi:MAG: pyruvate formate lyase family protein [Bacillota bacterium]
MTIFDIYACSEISEMAHELYREERKCKRLDGWFLVQEIKRNFEEKSPELGRERKQAECLVEIARKLPLFISDNAIFAGTQRDAFANSYALINPEFRVETFSGYCDPEAVYNDIKPNEEFTAERIEAQRKYFEQGEYAKVLKSIYKEASVYTREAVFFIEPVTGHVIPDFRYVLSYGIEELKRRLDMKAANEDDAEKRENYKAMGIALQSALILAERYAGLAGEKKQKSAGADRKRWELIENTLKKVPRYGAETLYESIQSFIILWQVMCLEQSPNPYAFSVGNADRIFEPYRKKDRLDKDKASQLFKHFLVFFNVGDRSWAISQNILVGGKSSCGEDITNDTSFALMEAYRDMNLPQPILSVKLHRGTPEAIYKEMGRFFFEPGCLTPSLFNDDSLFKVMENAGIDKADLEDYAVAGCQEPLIMGKDNGNTTNSWLNLAKILELTLNDGFSAITGEKIGTVVSNEPDMTEFLKNIRGKFYQNAMYFIEKMVTYANAVSRAVALCPVPFLSVFMGGFDTGYDMRDPVHQGTKYNASGCLIHGLTVVADSFVAIDSLLRDRPQDALRLPEALRKNFEGFEELREYLLTCPKYGNNIAEVDNEVVELASRISRMVKDKKNYLGNPFRADWSTPTTHLLYGYWVGATPDGRKAREMLNYGVDPLYGDAGSGLGFRILSSLKLPYLEFNGGYASHFGVDPKYFTGSDNAEKGLQFRDRVIKPLFFGGDGDKPSPFYLYVNVTTAEILRKVLENPEKYATGGVYIMRIHGTFVNFLDLSPAIQEDIIKRLDPRSTALY